MPYCSKCGQKIADDVTFCGNCGQKVGAANANQTENPEMQSATAGDAQSSFQQSAASSETITNEDYHHFIGKNADRYISKFTNFEAGNTTRFKATWHWPAFFVPFPWCLYRKLYLWALLAFFIPVILGFIIIFLTAAFTIGAGGLSDQQSISLLIKRYVVLCYIAQLAINIACGISANYIYYKHARGKIYGIKALPEPQRAAAYTRAGGVHKFIVWIAWILAILFLLGVVGITATQYLRTDNGITATQNSETDNIEMKFVYIPGGCFQMGDTFGDGNSDEKPVHEVCVSEYYMGKYEVTQGQWKEVMGNNPSEYKNCGDSCPVENVSWNDVQEFIRKLNNKSGKNYRLPTEAEWEYAARSGGKREKWAGTSSESSLEDYAWYNDNSGSKTPPVGQKQPNGLGLFDMTGNVVEWCSDWYGDDYYKYSPRDNPSGPSSGSSRVFRGGSWGHDAAYARAALRFRNGPDFRNSILGFRLVLPAGQ
jgi:formylglycine-generating enzyme